MPHELAQGMSAEGVGLRAPLAAQYAPRRSSLGESYAPRGGGGGGGYGGGGGGAPPAASRARPKTGVDSGGAPRSESDDRVRRAQPTPKGGRWPEDDDYESPSEMRRATPAPSAPASASHGDPESPREKASGFLEGVKRVLGFGVSKDESEERSAPPPPPPPAPPPPAAAAPAPLAPMTPPPPRASAPEKQKKLDLKPSLPRVSRNLRARVVIHSAGSLVIEVLVKDHALGWAPAATALVALADGTSITVNVDFTKTTRPGTIAFDASARLALGWPDGAPLVAPIRITIQCNGATIVLDL